MLPIVDTRRRHRLAIALAVVVSIIVALVLVGRVCQVVEKFRRVIIRL